MKIWIMNDDVMVHRSVTDNKRELRLESLRPVLLLTPESFPYLLTLSVISVRSPITSTFTFHNSHWSRHRNKDFTHSSQPQQLSSSIQPRRRTPPTAQTSTPTLNSPLLHWPLHPPPPPTGVLSIVKLSKNFQFPKCKVLSLTFVNKWCDFRIL